MIDYVSADEFVTILKQECITHGSQTAFAHRHGFSTGYINDVLHRRRAPSDKLAQSLGYHRIVSFRGNNDNNHDVRHQ